VPTASSAKSKAVGAVAAASGKKIPVIERFVQLMDGADAANDADGFATVTPQYSTTVGELARQIQAFKDSRVTLMTERVGIR
jgi:hypothetical protein